MKLYCLLVLIFLTSSYILCKDQPNHTVPLKKETSTMKVGETKDQSQSQEQISTTKAKETKIKTAKEQKNKLKHEQLKKVDEKNENKQQTGQSHKSHKNLLKNERAKRGFFLFDGETYQQDQIDFQNYIGNCFIKYNSTIYDLNPLSKIGSFFMNTKSGKSIEFDLCKNLISNCDNLTTGMIVSGKAGKPPCKKFADTWMHDKNWTWSDSNNFNLALPAGDTCNSSGEKYKVNVNLQCNLEAKAIKILNDGQFDEDSCTNTIKLQSIEGKLCYIIINNIINI